MTSRVVIADDAGKSPSGPIQGNFGTAQVGTVAPAQSTAVREYEEVKQRVHAKLVKGLHFADLQELNEQQRRTEVRSFLDRTLLEDPKRLTLADHERVIQELLDETLGFGPLETLLRDATITDILVNGANEVYVERRGRLHLTDVRFKDDDHLMQVIDRIVSRVGRRVDETSPMVDARLPDGSRVNAIIPPLSLRGPALSIRRFGRNPLRLRDLLEVKAFTREMALFIEATVKARLNILISGSTGSGKTTLLNVLSSFINEDERIITIEDAAELQLQQRHVVQLEARPPNVEGKGQVTIRDLVRNALRMRPERIVVGECRGAEALDMLQAMNTGHDGSMTTLHANSPRDALARLETMIMMAGYELPLKAMRQQISSAVQVIIQQNRLQGGVRRLTSISEVVGMEGETVVMQDLFHFVQTGVDELGRARGRFECLGIRPKLMARLESAGIHLPANLFEARTLLEA